MLQRRTFLAALAAPALAAPALPALAQAFPQAGKTLRVLVGYAAGGPTDTQARVLSQELGKALGVTVIVENKPGATGMIAAQELIRSAPDGYTLLYTIDGPLTQNPHTLKTPYDVFRDFTPLSRATIGGVVLTLHPSVPARNAKELVAYAKANPGKLSFGSFGTGSVSHIYGEVLAQNQGLDLVHVPYKGSADALKDLLAGRVQIMFDSPATSAAFVKEGKIHVIGSAGDTRRKLMPELPTLLEQGLPGFELRSWNGFFGPAKMPPAVADKLRQAMAEARRSAAFTDALKLMYSDTVDETPEQFEKAIRTYYERWGAYIQKLGIKIE
ncbi:MAG TPA: tripartite tricarboxylate transporter substrate binding protein [Ideonella sp.]|nr:tripartite tricarboxylate transporter substrate binding protein [Ideonella sp.]